MAKPTANANPTEQDGERAPTRESNGNVRETERRPNPRRGRRADAARPAPQALPKGLGPINAASGAAAVVASVAVILIAAQSRWTFTFADGLFWGGVVGFVVLRAVALRLAQPAERAGAFQQWTRRALLIGAAAVALWVGAQSVQSRAVARDARPADTVTMPLAAGHA